MVLQVWFVSPAGCNSVASLAAWLEQEDNENKSNNALVTKAQLQARVTELFSIPESDQRLLTLGGREVPAEGVCHGATVQVALRVVGGKGGFGSMLRSQGGRMASKHSTNFEACRDLQGRRLRMKTDAKVYAEWIKQQEELKKEKEEQLKRKIEAVLNEDEPRKKHFFEDPQYLQESAQFVEEMSDAVEQGIKQEKQLKEDELRKQKEKALAEKAAKKKLSMWDPDGVEVSSDEEETENSTEESSSSTA